mmetsp:Transcript_21271/g.50192  ORF Transcript_21271/g.50192 Transcript_21271/m.50192 type:complete len:250 (-) Transcript_21271:1356-2105(-)
MMVPPESSSWIFLMRGVWDWRARMRFFVPTSLRRSQISEGFNLTFLPWLRSRSLSTSHTSSWVFEEGDMELRRFFLARRLAALRLSFSSLSSSFRALKKDFSVVRSFFTAVFTAFRISFLRALSFFFCSLVGSKKRLFCAPSNKRSCTSISILADISAISIRSWVRLTMASSSSSSSASSSVAAAPATFLSNSLSNAALVRHELSSMRRQICLVSSSSSSSSKSNSSMICCSYLSHTCSHDRPSEFHCP